MEVAGCEDNYDYGHKKFLQTFGKTQEGSLVIKSLIAPDVPPCSGSNAGSGSATNIIKLMFYRYTAR